MLLLYGNCCLQINDKKTNCLAMQDFLSFGRSDDTKLVEGALLAARPYIGASAENLAPELSGRLLPYINVSASLRRLITDCDRSGVQHCALVPNFPYRQSSTGALQGTIVMDGRPTSYAVVGEDRRLLLVKDAASPSIQVVQYSKTRSSAVARIADRTGCQ